jgi:hypothetical protein
MTRTAREVVELYNLVVWNKRDFDLAEELMGDTVIRHDVGEGHTFTREQAVKRIVDTWEMSTIFDSTSTSWWPATTVSTSRSCINPRWS